MVDGTKRPQISGGRFDFEDGGTYCGGWDDGKAHGHGVCTGPKHQGAYAGAWTYGFEVSGAYIWPSGSHYEGQWQNGRRHGLGVEQIGRQIYRGEWSKDGHKGRYGIRESTVSTARYEGTWNMGYQDGYGCETYADGGKYQGQWQEGKRHGYGIRTSAPFGLASHYRRKDIHSSLNSLRSSDIGEVDKGRSEEIRGGFVLTAKSDKLPTRRNSLTEKTKKGFLSGFKMRKQKSTGDLEKRGTLTSSSVRSTTSTSSWVSTGSEQSNLTTRSTRTDSNASFTMEDEQLDSAVTETYMGEWKKDKRCGHGVAERSDGLKYEGEWYNNKKHGYGVTTFRDGSFEEGKYKNNILITSQKKKHLFLARSRKFRDRITIAVNSAQRALKMAMQRSDIAISRTSTASDRAQNADIAADQARDDCEVAVRMAREFAPDFKPSVLERFEKMRFRNQIKYTTIAKNSILSPYTGNVAEPIKTGSILKEMSRSDLNQHIRQESNMQLQNSVQPQKLHVTPQTDFVSLVNQQSYSGSNPFTPMYSSQIKQNEQPSSQYQENAQQNNVGHFSRHMELGTSSSIGNSNLTQGSRMEQNEIPAQYNRNNPNKTNYVSSTNSDQLDGNVYPIPGLESNTMPNNFQTILNEQHLQQTSLQTSTQALPNKNSHPTRAPSQQREVFGSIRKQTKPHPFNEMNQQLSIDYFDHYKRPPSRDSSIDRYARTTSRVSESAGYTSRQSSVDKTLPLQTRDVTSPNKEMRTREGSNLRESLPRSAAMKPAFNVSNQSISGMEKTLPINKPFEDVLLYQRSLGQDIIPSPMTPKRTESLYTPPKGNFPKDAAMSAYNYAGSKPLKLYLGCTQELHACARAKCECVTTGP
ncbi:junctophilin-1-like [Anastrepha ludens]|uniref:junctophilin-1-like n=1 Tax=Anastrepha ludens TaxID=28586 RepID=UPI0023AF7BCD|nr:junctophilin-1-like [Anastrepha ludens]